MLLLVFHLGSDRYALSTEDVIEVLPLIALKRVPMAPPGVVGLLNYHGQSVPVLDLSLLTLGQPAAQRVSTRLLITGAKELAGQAAVEPQLLGLIVERATETLHRHEADFHPGALAAAEAPYFGAVTLDEHGLIQRINLGALRESLFPAAARSLAS